jgi:hypothetical protein
VLLSGPSLNLVPMRYPLMSLSLDLVKELTTHVSREWDKCPSDNSYSLFTAHAEYATDPATAHRPLPGDLISNMTARGPLATVKTVGGYYRSSWSKSKYNTSCGIASRRRQWYDGHCSAPGYSIFGVNGLPALPSTYWETDARVAIKDNYVNLANDIAEYRETADMFKDVAHGIRDAWRLFHGRLPKRKRRYITACDVPAAYLQYEYGVGPLVGTLYDSLERLDPVLANPPLTRQATSSRASTTYGISSAGNWVSARATVRNHVVTYVRHENGYSGFTIGNPLEWAWEAIPFSFLVDVVANVGDTLSSLDALRGVTFVAGCNVTEVTSSAEGDYAREISEHCKPDPTRNTVEFRSYSRSLLSSVPLPTGIRWRPSGTWHKLRNAVAVLFSVNEKCRKGRR